MRMLFLGVNFHPEVTGDAPFSTDLCTYLARQGHDVTAIVSFPHYPEWRVYEGYRGKLFVEEHHQGVRLFRVPMYIPRRPSPARRVIYDSSFALSALVAGVSWGGAPDLIVAICSPLQLGVVASLLAMFRQSSFIYHLQDLLPDGAVALGMLSNPVAIGLAERMAEFVYSRADLVTAIGQGFIDSLVAKGVSRGKLVCLPNWVDTEWIRPLPRMNSFRDSVRVSQDEFLVMYVGNFGAKQGMETVVEAARLLEKDNNVKFILVGDGTRKQEVVRLADNYKLTNIQFLGVQRRDILPEMLAASDLLLLHQRREVVDMVVPSKLLAYSAAQRPILLAGVPASEGAKFVASAECGRIVSPENPEALAEAIRDIEGDPDQRQRMARNARCYVDENFFRGQILQRAEKLYLDTAERGRTN